METKSCIYCGRTLDLNKLIERGGKYRCKDENDCLEYQTKEDPADSIENADYIADVIKASLTEAARRIAAYTGPDEGEKSGTGGPVESSEASIAEFTWMKTVVDAMASEYKLNQKFVFQYDETTNTEYRISFNDADDRPCFTVKIDHTKGSIYALTVAKEDGGADRNPLYKEFIYRSYPSRQREDVIKDLSVVLISLEEASDRIPALLKAFRSEIESRCYHTDH